MEIKCGSTTTQGPNATVLLNSGDSLSVGYTDPSGKFHTINIIAQHLVLMAVYEPTGDSIIIRPAVGVQFSQGTR